MQYHGRDWMRAFAERARIRDREEVERSARTIAYELGGCLTWGEAQRLAGQLPDPLADAIREGSFGTAMARFSAWAFVRRVAERDRISLEEARRRVFAFLALVREELPRSDVERLEDELASWRTELAS